MISSCFYSFTIAYLPSQHNSVHSYIMFIFLKSETCISLVGVVISLYWLMGNLLFFWVTSWPSISLKTSEDVDKTKMVVDNIATLANG